MRLEDANVAGYLRRIGLLEAERADDVCRPGPGNINYVRRVRAGARSWIVKQAREQIENFPEWSFPTDRIVYERRYYAELGRLVPACAAYAPDVLYFDEPERILVLADAGSRLLRDELAEGRAHPRVFEALGQMLGSLHRASAPIAGQLEARFENVTMRAAHGIAFFWAPYEPNDWVPEPELRARADCEAARPEVRERLEELRACYLQAHSGLVHGDFVAANVLVGAHGPKVIDAEFAHVGDPVFDLGVLLGHLHVYLAQPRAPSEYREAEMALLEAYAHAAPSGSELLERARRYAGVEVVRQTIGDTRLPYLLDLERASSALSHGVELLLS